MAHPLNVRSRPWCILITQRSRIVSRPGIVADFRLNSRKTRPAREKKYQLNFNFLISVLKRKLGMAIVKCGFVRSMGADQGKGLNEDWSVVKSCMLH